MLANFFLFPHPLSWWCSVSFSLLLLSWSHVVEPWYVCVAGPGVGGTEELRQAALELTVAQAGLQFMPQLPKDWNYNQEPQHLAHLETIVFSKINGPSPPTSGPLHMMSGLFEKHFPWPARIRKSFRDVLSATFLKSGPPQAP